MAVSTLRWKSGPWKSHGFAKESPMYSIFSQLGKKPAAVGGEESGRRKDADAFRVFRERTELFGAYSKTEYAQSVWQHK